VGLYGEVKQDFGPGTPEEAVWKQAVEQKTHVYTALRPDSFSDWSTRNHMGDLAKEDTAEIMRYWYERAVDEQKKELREYRKKLKAQETQLPQIELIPVSENGSEASSQGQENGAEPEEA